MSEALVDTGKGGYDWQREFAERTERALLRRDGDNLPMAPSAEMYAAGRLWEYDALLTDDTFAMLLNAVPYLARARRYRILDAGCGYGRCSPVLSAFDCAAYVGVDATDDRIVYARERYGSKVVSFIHSDLSDLVVADQFDFVFCCTVLQHLPNEKKLRVIAALKAAMKPTATLLLHEGRIVAEGDAEAEYAKRTTMRHMIPITEAEFRAAWLPFVLTRQGQWFVGHRPEGGRLLRGSV